MDYPGTLEFNAPLKVARWRVIGNYVLAIPHIIVLYVLGIIGLVVDVLSWLAILATGKLPAGLAGVNCMLIRYSSRVWTYMSFMRESYPPFDFDTSAQDNGKDPEVVVNIEPELEGRNRLTVLFRIVLFIPVTIASAVWMVVWMIVILLSFFAVLITGTWPEGFRDIAVKISRFSVRASTYRSMLTDKYPPLGLS